jgi:hypothetical protein
MARLGFVVTRGHSIYKQVSCPLKDACLTPYLPSTTSIPESTRLSFDCDSRPACSVSRLLSRLTICETLATESFGSPVARDAESKRCPVPRPTSSYLSVECKQQSRFDCDSESSPGQPQLACESPDRIQWEG